MAHGHTSNTPTWTLETLQLDPRHSNLTQERWHRWQRVNSLDLRSGEYLRRLGACRSEQISSGHGPFEKAMEPHGTAVHSLSLSLSICLFEWKLVVWSNSGHGGIHFKSFRFFKVLSEHVNLALMTSREPQCWLRFRLLAIGTTISWKVEIVCASGVTHF